jgi:HAD superfamily hydrolase (TIGR01509 family)
VTRIRELNKKFDFLKDFDVQVFSYDVGVTKPDKKIFESLVKKSKVDANQIVYSDDSPIKLSGAEELGIHTFVFENVDGFVEKLEEFQVL